VLEGKKVNLRIMEKIDLPLFVAWNNDPFFGDEYEPLDQTSLAEIERWYDNLRPEERWFIIEKKDGTKIGQILHVPNGPHYSIGFRIIQGERNRGYCTEAVKIMVDYLFLSKSIVRIEAETNPKNIASQRVLEKSGFLKEGLTRKSVFIRGEWHDGARYSILREEWKKLKTLSKAT
jgi:ribosomal-protein-alanine N-acetyltransferase